MDENTDVRARILEADDLKRSQVDIPEWGGSYFVREMGGAELATFQEACTKKDEPGANVRLAALLVALCLCDADGKRTFADADADELLRKSFTVLERVATAAVAVNPALRPDGAPSNGS